MTDKQLQEFKKANNLKKIQKELLSDLIYVISLSNYLTTKEKNSVLEPLANLQLIVSTKIHIIHKQKNFKKEMMTIDLMKLCDMI